MSAGPEEFLAWRGKRLVTWPVAFLSEAGGAARVARVAHYETTMDSAHIVTRPGGRNGGQTDFLGLRFKVGYIEYGSYVVYDDRTGTFGGSIGTVFETIREMLNFTYAAVPSVDGFYGKIVENEGPNTGAGGSLFNGLVGMLERKEVDIALADLSLSLDRSRVGHQKNLVLLFY